MAVSVSRDRIWSYFMENREDLRKNMHRVAVNAEIGVEVYITEKSGLPLFVVELDGINQYEEIGVSRMDAEDTYDNILNLLVEPDRAPAPKAPAPKAVEPKTPAKTESASKGNKKSDNDEDKFTEADKDRLEELDIAAREFLEVLLGSALEEALDDDIVEDFILDAEAYLHGEYGFFFYHPTIVDGVIVRYPFDDLDEDECE